MVVNKEGDFSIFTGSTGAAKTSIAKRDPVFSLAAPTGELVNNQRFYTKAFPSGGPCLKCIKAEPGPFQVLKKQVGYYDQQPTENDEY